MSRHYGLPSQAKLALAPGPDQTISRRQLLHHVRVYPLSPGDVSRRMCFGQDGIDYEDGGVWLPPGRRGAGVRYAYYPLSRREDPLRPRCMRVDRYHTAVFAMGKPDGYECGVDMFSSGAVSASGSYHIRWN
jgi:hypothetical protein